MGVMLLMSMVQVLWNDARIQFHETPFVGYDITSQK